MIREMPPEALEEGLRVNRETLLGEIFRRFPEQLSSRGKRARGVIQWRIGGRDDGGYDHWFVVLENGECRTGRDLDLKPRVTLTVGALEFLQLATGNADPLRMLMRRTLRVRGDLIFAGRIQTFFRIPGRVV
jgi:hypothetical protein